MSVKIENASYSYVKSENSVLNRLNLVVNDGEILVLLGLNGCGKTTLIKNIAGLLKLNDGFIYVNGKNIFEMSIKERSQNISYVSQRNANLDDVLVKDYLTFGFANDLKFYEKPKVEHLKKVEEYAERFRITHLLKKFINEISGGERQIVSICCAVLQNTPIVLLDEPTSALDLKNQNVVLSILSEIAKKENKTIILSSHNPNHALYLNSEVALMKHGTIVKKGKAQDIVKPEILNEVYGDNVCYSAELSYREISFF